MTTEIDFTGSNQRMDRGQAVPALIGDHRDFLVVAGLAGTAQDMYAIEQDADNCFLLGGAMGASVSMGIGLALAQPDHHVLVLCGDGELLMNVSALATVMAAGVVKFSILCVDNERYGETGNQITHTSMGTDLAMTAKGLGIRHTMTVTEPGEIPAAHDAIRRPDGPTFVHLKVSDVKPPKLKSRNFNAAERRLAFRKALLGRI
jgi:phosphonopyruvate decarboxylase